MEDEEEIVKREIRREGGEIMRIGMNVDKGNMMVMGKMGRKYIIEEKG